MEQFPGLSSAESGIKFLEKALNGLSIQRKTTNSTSSAEEQKPATDDKGPLGLTLLYAPSEPMVDFVFVHGLGGGSRKTWSKSKNPYHYWPKEWLPRDPDFKHVRIHVFGYKADWGERQDSVLDVSDFAHSLLGDIKDNPDIRRSNTSVVLIGHSMGGLVMKQAYILARQDATFGDLASRFHTMFFLATPHRGSDLAKTLTIILKISYGQKPFVNDLERNSSLVSLINDTFRHFSDALQLWSFYETLKSRILVSDVMIVDKSSATLGYSNERVALLNANHRGMVKFDTPSDPNYKTLRNAFATTVDTIISEVLESQKQASKHDLSLLRSFLGVSSLPEDELFNLEEKRLPNSCGWLTSGREFESWKNASIDAPPVFWLTGNPASGKSVLASHVISYFDEHDIDCSYFFFKHGTENKSTISELLRSIAYQMALKNSDIRQRLILLEADGVLLDKHDERVVFRRLFLRNIFLSKPFHPHFWVIDALDECRVVQSLFSMFEKVNKETIPLRIFVTSRKTQTIERGMLELGGNILHREIQIGDTARDIKAFIDSRIDKLPVDEDGQAILTERILSKAAGSFLWVRLVVSEMEKTFSAEALTGALNDIPADMNTFYAQTFDKIAEGRGAKLARTILTWVVCASRPLSLNELQSAIRLDVNETVQNLSKSIPSICGQLVFVDGQSRVNMVHQTAKDYLLHEDAHPAFAIKKGASNLHLARKCMEMLSGDSLKTSRVRSKKFGSKAAITKDVALVDYACAFFSDHLHKSSSADPEIMEAIYNFLTRNVLNWIERLAKSGGVHHITRAASNIQTFLERRAKYSPLSGPQVQIMEAWVVDLIRISAQFKNILVTLPASIHWLIPPVCPKGSIIHKSYTSPHRGLSVKGLKARTWDDCLLQIDYPDSQATAVNHGQQFFAVGLSTGLVVIYTADSGRYTTTLVHGERVRLVEFGRSDKIIASSGFRKVRVWDMSDGTELWSFDSLEQTLSIVFSEDNDYLMAASQGNCVNCWNLEENGELKIISWEGVNGDTSPKETQKQPPTHVSFSPDHDLVAVAYRGHPVLLFNLESETFFGNCVQHVGQKTFDPVMDLSFNPNSDMNLLVVSYHNGALVLYNPLTTELVHEVPAAHAHTLRCSPDGKTLVTGSPPGTIQVYDFGGANGAMLTLLYRIDASEEGIRSIAFSNDSLRFVDIRGARCCVWEPTVLIRKDCDHGSHDEPGGPVSLVPKTVRALEKEREVDITSTACHPSGEVVFCGMQDGSIAIYTTKDGQRGSTLYRHASDVLVTAIVYGESCGILVSADESGRIISRKVTNSGTEWSSQLLADKRAPGAIKSLLINPESNLILVGGRLTAEIWTTAGELVGKAPKEILSLEQTIQDPHQPDYFILLEDTSASFYRWADFQPVESHTLSLEWNGSGSERTSTTFCDHDVLVRFEKPNRNKSKATIQLHQSPIFESPMIPPTPIPGFDVLGPSIEHFISVVDNKLLFINTDLWICSLDIKTFAANPQVKRHFFLPSDWQVTSGDIMTHFTAKKEFIFVKRSELVVISRGLDFSEIFTLSDTTRNAFH